MAHPSVDALRVKARGEAVRSLRDQGLTWVAFDPIPDLVRDIDFGIRKLPEFACYPEPCGACDTCMRIAIAAMETTISAFI
jgi:hypothetical protein